MAEIRSRSARRPAPRKTAARKSASPRPAQIAAVSTPLIARAPETSNEYLARLATLMSDSGTHIYFDTSFLMWLAKLGRPARTQFFAWVTTEGDIRFNVPLWAAHEFFKHQVRNTVLSEFGSELSSFEKAANRLYEKIRSFCSDRLFGFPNSGDMFLNEYRRTVQPLRAMLGLAKKNGEDEIDFANGEVASFVDAHLLPGPLSKVTKNIEKEERVRNRGTIPPSFNDAHKRSVREEGDNSFGDLVFWKEILRHAANMSARALIVATGDRKNDWFVNYHGNDSVSPDLRRKVQNPRPVPLPHPLLVREASDHGAGELALIDPVYCAALMDRKGQQYKAFAAAAMDTTLPKLVTKNLEGQVWASRMGQVARLVATPALKEGDIAAADGGDEVQGAEAVSPPLDPDLLGTSPDDCSPAARQLFAELAAAADVTVRAELYGQIEWEGLGDWSSADLVVLGGKIARAAEGGDPSAARLVSDLRDQAASIPAATANAVYLGALGATYFDEEGARRPPAGSVVSQTLLDVVTLPALGQASSALGAALSETSPEPAFVPGGDASAIELEFVIRPSADNRSPADLVSINLRGRNLTTETQTEEGLRFTSIFQRPQEARDFTVAELGDAIARFHLLPRQLVQPNLESASVVRVAEYAGVDIET